MAEKPLNDPFAESFAANPVLIDPMRAAQATAMLQTLASEQGQALLNWDMSADQDFWNPRGEGGHPYRPYNVSNGTLTIPVNGVLLNQFSFAFGRWATGYQYIEKALARGLADPGVARIALTVNSPGGEVAGCFECGDKIFEARGKKPIRAFAADHAYSAAYALASAAGQISVTRSGGTGSVGVVTMHVSVEKALERMGLEVTYIFAGKHKIDGNAYNALPDSVKARIQERIDRIYGVFTGAVARNRRIEESAVRATEALTFDAQDSVENDFADRIGALEEEMAVFDSETATESEGESLMTTNTESGNAAKTYTQAELDQAVASAKADGNSEGVNAERARRETILGSDEAKTRPEAASAFVDEGMEAEAAVRMLKRLPAESAEKTEGAVEGSHGTGRTKDTNTAQGEAFDNFMKSNGGAGVGSDIENDEMSDDDKAVNAIVGAAKAYHGSRAN